jgi:hypothetical protein
VACGRGGTQLIRPALNPAEAITMKL